MPDTTHRAPMGPLKTVEIFTSSRDLTSPETLSGRTGEQASHRGVRFRRSARARVRYARGVVFIAAIVLHNQLVEPAKGLHTDEGASRMG
jgi:hypothetical protein